jgi:sugar phosphate isomerase/epimerase
MDTSFNRRRFLKSAAGTGAALGLATLAGDALAGLLSRPRRRRRCSCCCPLEPGAPPMFKISLAEWSLHRRLRGGELDNLDFPALTKNEFGIDCVEYVNVFFMDKAQDTTYLSELKRRCDDLGVTSGLIMCDAEGNLGDPNDAARTKAVENHYKWVEAAKYLGCHSIRVNARSEGSYDEQLQLAVDGLGRLSEFAAQYGLNVIVENHGGLSSNGAWLTAVMQQVGRSNCGTLPDFGNFQTSPGEWYDRYQGVRELMPYAKAVSAKSHEFDADGNETETDYVKMLQIVMDAGYHGYIGIEYEGADPDELQGIRLTQRLMERVREQLA